jgi:hypothetical protein
MQANDPLAGETSNSGRFLVRGWGVMIPPPPCLWCILSPCVRNREGNRVRVELSASAEPSNPPAGPLSKSLATWRCAVEDAVDGGRIGDPSSLGSDQQSA